MRTSFIVSWAVIMLLGACNAPSPSQKQGAKTIVSNADLIIGQWSNLSIVVTHNFQTDSARTEVTDTSNWLEKLKIKPILTTFKTDSTYSSEYRNAQDSLVYNPQGKWWITGDSLYMSEHKQAVNAYHFGIKDNQATFRCMIDWDGDNKKDDEYIGVQIKH